MKSYYEDGELTEDELKIIEQMRIDRRQNSQKKMAWVAMISMIVFTVVMFLPFLPNDRIAILTDIAALFYIAQAGVTAAYMGSEALVNRTKTDELYRNRTTRPDRDNQRGRKT